MKTQVLIIAIIKNHAQDNGVDDAVLLRKKPEGAPPYVERDYLYGAPLTPGEEPEATVQARVKKQTGLDVRLVEPCFWGTEVKPDLKGVPTQYAYLYAIFECVGGKIVVGDPEIEEVFWARRDRLGTYDNVPPSVEAFRRLGWL